MKLDTSSAKAILNGLLVFKMNNFASSLDGKFGGDRKKSNCSNGYSVAAVGLAMMFGAFVSLKTMVYKNSCGSQWSSMFLTGGFGWRFTFSEIQESTKNFDLSSIIGVGGFGNVYLGTIDGNQVAVKRRNR
ncbi:hypothetical protein Nepgr_025427 [Nepenthes gracilis]|uniref:Protein kinase domain-containing protein n=1 Tax=Nepenthes gracilis TaxID=150966 RepID=A0AAD3T6V2_NEPGR|nr:hypothetical protein Nepgr_025427 [Nepenthes gracilis]